MYAPPSRRALGGLSAGAGCKSAPPYESCVKTPSSGSARRMLDRMIPWPELHIADSRHTYATLQLYVQIVGKIR